MTTAPLLVSEDDSPLRRVLMLRELKEAGEGAEVYLLRRIRARFGGTTRAGLWVDATGRCEAISRARHGGDHVHGYISARVLEGLGT